MRKIMVILLAVMICMVSISCTKTDADDLREVNLADAVQEIIPTSTGSASLTHDDVTNIFNKARELYKNSNSITLTSGEIITPVSVANIDLAYAQSLNSSNNAAALEAYQTYLNDVFNMGIDMIESMVDENAVWKTTKSNTTNIIRADMIIALDLEGCDSESVSEVLEKMHNGHPEYQDDIIAVLSSGIMAYDVTEDKAFVMYPNNEESQIRDTLMNPVDPNVVAE